MAGRWQGGVEDSTYVADQFRSGEYERFDMSVVHSRCFERQRARNKDEELVPTNRRQEFGRARVDTAQRRRFGRIAEGSNDDKDERSADRPESGSGPISADGASLR
jgi:hypothetical protein